MASPGGILQVWSAGAVRCVRSPEGPRRGAVPYDDFVSSVQARGGRPHDETETLANATLRVLAGRLTAGEADDLRAQLRGDPCGPHKLVQPPA
jgi:hypothetical protein